MNLKNIFKKMDTKENAKPNDTPDIENEGVKAEKENDISPEDEKKTLQAKVDELNDKYLRLYSEFDNYRKRINKERIELIKTAGEDIFKGVLPIMDDFERALKSTNEVTDIHAAKEGINLIYHKFKNTLNQKGLEEVVSIGKEFNTDMHEAITKMPAPSDDLKGKVVDELEKGYLLHGKVIRFAKVVVGE